MNCLNRGSKAIFSIAAVAALVALPLAALTAIPAAGGPEVTVIVATNSLLADFTREIAGEELADQVTIEFIMPAGACPAHFDVRPSDAALIASAEVVISLGWEPWLSNLLQSTGNEDAYQIRCAGLGDWNTPEGVGGYVSKIMTELGTYRPEWADDLETNAAGYLVRVEEAFESARALVDTEGLAGTKVVTIEWYVDLLELLGFDVVLSYGSPEGLSTADVLNVTRTLEDPEIALVIDNLQSGVDFGANVASSAGKPHAVLSNFPGAIPGYYTYLENVEYNVNELIYGAKAYQSQLDELASLESRISSLEFQRAVLISITGILATLLAIAIVIGRRRW